MPLHLKKISDKKVKITNPRKWAVMVHIDTSEITRVPDKPFPTHTELKNISENLVKYARFFAEIHKEK